MNAAMTAERLNGYYAFEPTVVERVAESVEALSRYQSYAEAFARIGVPEIEHFSPDSDHTVDVIDIRPDEHDPKKALVLHLPMANALDPHNVYALASFAYAAPHERIIAMGNRGGGKWTNGKLTFSEQRKVARGDFTPVVEPMAAYLDREGVDYIDNVGLSYGTELVAALNAKGTVPVKHSVFIEPASEEKRNTLDLALRFKSSEPALAGYVAANGLPTLDEAWKEAVVGGDYVKALLAPTNITVAFGLAKGHLRRNAIAGRNAQGTSMETTFAWGTESELNDDTRMVRLAGMYEWSGANPKPYPTQTIRLEGQRHALMNDLALQNAIILQGINPLASA